MRWARPPLTDPAARPFTRESGRAPQDLAAAERQFARDFLSVLPFRRQNAVWSPWGLYQAIAMGALGARGATAQDLSRVLHADRGRLKAGIPEARRALDSTGVEWTDECRVFHRPKVAVRPDYAALLKATFGAGVAPFDSVEPLNGWIAEATRRRLPGALQPSDLSPEDVVVLVDAFYLKAPWETPFAKEDTRPLPFRSYGEEQAVPTMAGLRYLPTVARKGYRVAEFEYAGGRLVFDILLPERDDGLEELERGLTRQELEAPFAALQPDMLSVQLPRFSFLTDEEVLPALVGLGFPTTGDYSGIASVEVGVRNVLSITGIRVDEEGTEAAGAVVDEFYSPAPPPPISFHVDHPALFLVRDRLTGVLLLMGRLVQPVETWN